MQTVPMFVSTAENTPLVVLGTGQARRQFIYSRDVARIVVWMIRNYGHIEPLILADDVESEMTIEELARLICKVMNFEGPMQFDLSKTDGAPCRTVTNARLRKCLPDFKFTSMEQALKEAADWYIENIKTARR